VISLNVILLYLSFTSNLLIKSSAIASPSLSGSVATKTISAFFALAFNALTVGALPLITDFSN